ncbi:nucleoside monophosphate kinase, partial [Pelagibacteraceae bacterium]|nr:nucleoside monophosphate kinase [Pelagibacteraceae bacterium]
KEYKQKISCTLNLRVDRETVIKRITGRQICSKCGLIFNEFFNPVGLNNHNCDSKFLYKRSDDNEKTIVDRYDSYIKKTLPILEYYKSQKILYEIGGKSVISKIYAEISRIIQSLEA